MEPTLFQALQRITERPAPFSRSTVRSLWTEPHLAEQMLRFHLDGASDLASRRTAIIEASVDWMTRRFGIGPATRVADLGCGPGLYANRLAATGADVTGVDFSRRALEHARTTAARRGQAVIYVEADYLAWEPAGRFDLVTMIFCDYCALGPDQRARLLERIGDWLKPGGAFLFDVVTLGTLAAKEEGVTYAPDLMDGFWSRRPYHGFRAAFRYEAVAVTLDRYTIIEEAETREYLNWLQCFSLATLTAELARSGFTIEAVLGDVAGHPYDPAAPEMAVIARPLPR